MSNNLVTLWGQSLWDNQLVNYCASFKTPLYSNISSSTQLLLVPLDPEIVSYLLCAPKHIHAFFLQKYLVSVNYFWGSRKWDTHGFCFSELCSKWNAPWLLMIFWKDFIKDNFLTRFTNKFLQNLKQSSLGSHERLGVSLVKEQGEGSRHGGRQGTGPQVGGNWEWVQDGWCPVESGMRCDRRGAGWGGRGIPAACQPYYGLLNLSESYVKV